MATDSDGQPGVQVRAAVREDHPAMLEVDRLTWSTTISPGAPPTEETDLFARREPGDHLVAVMGDGTVTGFIALGHPTPLPSSRHVIEIQGLAVHPDHTGQGVGRMLLDAAVAEARNRGARKVSLRVLGHNERARRLYEAAGFEVEGVLRAEFILDGRPVDDVLMARHLS